MSDHAFAETILVHGKHCIAGSTSFKCPYFLKIVSFEEQLTTKYFIELGTLQNRCAVDVGLYPFMGLLDIFNS